MYDIDLSETDGEDDDEKILEMDGVPYPHKSWFFIFHSTIEGKYFCPMYFTPIFTI